MDSSEIQNPLRVERISPLKYGQSARPTQTALLLRQNATPRDVVLPEAAWMAFLGSNSSSHVSKPFH